MRHVTSSLPRPILWSKVWIRRRIQNKSCIPNFDLWPGVESKRSIGKGLASQLEKALRDNREETIAFSLECNPVTSHSNATQLLGPSHVRPLDTLRILGLPTTLLQGLMTWPGVESLSGKPREAGPCYRRSGGTPTPKIQPLHLKLSSNTQPLNPGPQT